MADSLNLDVEAGATWNAYSFQYLDDDGVTPIDLTTWTGKVQVRETPTSASYVFQVTPTLDAAGNVSFEFTATQTALLTNYQYVWACELYASNGDVVRLIEGKIFVSPEVVR
jgi:hypothetical protein